MSKKILLTSGGTGGHVFPAINLMKHLLQKGYKIVFVTSDETLKNYFDKKLFYNYSELKIYSIKTDTINKNNILKSTLAIIKIFVSLFKSLIILKKEKPNIIIGFGGYISFPISFCSKFFNISLLLYESNLVLGRTNKYLLPIAKKLFVSSTFPINLPKKYKKKTYKVGSILSKNIINYHPKKRIKKKYFLITVFGGSQGAEIFGKKVPAAIKMLKEDGYNIRINQQCLKHQKSQIISFYKKNKIKNKIFTFEKNILKLISKTDLAISRSGANTTAELVETCTPFISIPYPYAMDNHQYLNAKYYRNKNYNWILKESDFNSSNLYKLLVKIIDNKKNLNQMREKMKNNKNNSVYKNIEKLIEKN